MSALLNSRVTQSAELSLLVNLEARWENLRANRVVNPGKQESATDLLQRQKAYDAFQSKLATYNKSFKPAHVPERLLISPRQICKWCRKMRDLLGRLDQSSGMLYPAHLLEKAYRSADRVADRLHKEYAARPVPSNDISGAVRELELLALWCESVSPVE